MLLLPLLRSVFHNFGRNSRWSYFTYDTLRCSFPQTLSGESYCGRPNWITSKWPNWLNYVFSGLYVIQMTFLISLVGHLTELWDGFPPTIKNSPSAFVLIFLRNFTLFSIFTMTSVHAHFATSLSTSHITLRKQMSTTSKTIGIATVAIANSYSAVADRVLVPWVPYPCSWKSNAYRVVYDSW